MSTPNTTKRHKAGHCDACGKPWIEHLGIMGTCDRLQKARTGLQILHTWASVRGGIALVPDDVMKLCLRILKETTP